MRSMNYETFIHKLALEIRGYLPKNYRDYEVVVKCERGQDTKTARLTLEKGATTYYCQVELLPYYEKYQNGECWEQILGEVRDHLLKPKVTVMQKKRRISVMVLAAAGMAVIFLGGVLWLLGKRRKDGVV